MRRRSFGFGRINLANGDMVGHTGSLLATIKAVEAVDQQLARLMAAADQTGTILVVTADHGNADEMFDAKEKDFPNWRLGAREGQPKARTAHSLADVPFAIYGRGSERFELAGITPRSLGNIASTMIALLGLPPNKIYLPSLIRPKGS
jgi:2,3-bisphosphoglycerate-independent phosphoglycerate mutase